jgi:hypothetical protein
MPTNQSTTGLQMPLPIQKLDLKLDVFTAMLALELTAEWDRYKTRTSSQTSPHRDTSDVWARFAKLDDPALAANQPFKSVWYNNDPAMQEALEPLVQQVYDHVKGQELGGVLLTKIPAGKKVHRHRDQGWHAGYFSKFNVCIQADEKQVFAFDDAELRCKTGAVFWFRNDIDHWVNNDSDQDRISMIVCIRTAQGPLVF